MELEADSVTRIILPKPHWQSIMEHCRRKLSGPYLPGEVEEKKAYGLVAGSIEGGVGTVGRCIALLKNVREEGPYRLVMDGIMARHAVPSETPLAKRGWVAEPGELLAAVKGCKRDTLVILGMYHMHRVAWQHDRLRNTPTIVDTVLAEKSRMLIFIVSMVSPEQPTIRAFFEGSLIREIPIIIENE